jgi:5'-methylthioadenosine phosphorylase
MSEQPRPEAGIIGGSGFYEFLDDVDEFRIGTPYGEPSAAVAVGTLQGRQVAFLPRHGRQHEFPPHRVNYRANLWALRAIGVRRILGPCAVGSLQPHLGPGDLVVPDQLVDRTTGRVQTFMDDGAAHVGFAEPFCPALQAALAAADPGIHDGGTIVVIEGPRFSTKAESQWYAGQGWSLVNMTIHPEAVLARELALCYASISLVTDRDAGIGGSEAVSQAEVFEQFARNIDRLKALLTQVLAGLPRERMGCTCAASLEGLEVPFVLP